MNSTPSRFPFPFCYDFVRIIPQLLTPLQQQLRCTWTGEPDGEGGDAHVQPDATERGDGQHERLQRWGGRCQLLFSAR